MLQKDRMFGLLLMVVAIAVFSYYTVWTLVLPILPANTFIASLFPDRYWAVAIPVILLVILLSVVGLLTSIILLKTNNKNKKDTSGSNAKKTK